MRCARLASGEAYPVAVLPPPIVAAMRAETQVVKVSDYDPGQAGGEPRRAGFRNAGIPQAQLVIEAPRLLVSNERMTLFLSDAGGDWYAAVLQRTASGKGVFLKSYRRSSERDASSAKGSAVLIDTLEG